jgi:hypothetical protein
VFLPLVAAVFCGFVWLPLVFATAAGTAALVIAAIYSLRAICRLVSLDRLPRAVRTVLALCRIVTPQANVPFAVLRAGDDS